MDVKLHSFHPVFMTLEGGHLDPDVCVPQVYLFTIGHCQVALNKNRYLRGKLRLGDDVTDT